MTNPYTPPGAPVRDPGGGPRRSSLAAIGVGFAADIVATMIFSTVLSIVAAVMLASGGESLEQLAEVVERSAGFQFVGLVGGLCCTALGGYVAARFANHSEYANAFAVGLASLLFGEAMMMYAAEPPALWLRLLSDVLVVPAALAGGHLYTRRKAAAA